MALSLMESHHNQSTVTREDEGGYTPRSCLHREGYAPASSCNNHDKRERQRYGGDESSYNRKDENRRPKKYSSDYGSNRTRHGRRTPGKSDWDDRRCEWEDTPRRGDCGHSTSRPSPSPMLIGASPDACLVSPRLGGNTPRFAGWDDRRWEWEQHIMCSPDACLVSPRLGGNTPRSADTPRRGDCGHSMSRRHHYPSPSPMLIGASPESCLVSPRLGGNTPRSTGWDDRRWEWEDTPRRGDCGHSMSQRHHYPSPSPMLLGTSPESCPVCPRLGGNTPCSTVSSWDHISPSSVPIRASGSSRRHSDSCQAGTSHQLAFSVASSAEGSGAGRSPSVGGQNYDCSVGGQNYDSSSDDMREEMDYNADRAWNLN